MLLTSIKHQRSSPGFGQRSLVWATRSQSGWGEQMNRILWTSALTVLAAIVARDQAIGAEPDLVLRGRHLAERVCGVCHIVSPERTDAPFLRNPGPPFAAIAARPSTSEAGLRAYLASRHPDIGRDRHMPNPRLADDQIDEVVAYILSLRGGAR